MNICAEPFVGDELISIVVAASAVELHFQRNVLQIGGHFILSRPGHADEQFEPEKKLGAVQALWTLIGQSVVATRWGPNWGDTVEVVFDNAALIRILPTAEGFRGTILGQLSPTGSLQIEDF